MCPKRTGGSEGERARAIRGLSSVYGSSNACNRQRSLPVIRSATETVDVVDGI